MIENLLYTALATLIVIVILHVGVFWVSRVIQPPKARVVYMPSPPVQAVYNTLPPAQPAQPAPQVIQQQPLMQPHPQSVAQMAPPPPPEIKLPTYDSPPAPPALPPPIETRDPGRS
jgi:hypothetical protein